MRLAVAMIALVFTGFLWAVSGVETAHADLSDPGALVARASIVIVGDADFEDPTTSGVSDGAGTPADPYIIENWDIDDNSYPWDNSKGVWIQGTTKSFIIKNVWVHNGDLEESPVLISDVHNGVMTNCRVTDNHPNWAAIDLGGASTDIEISNTRIAFATIYFGYLAGIMSHSNDQRIVLENNDIDISNEYGVVGIHIQNSTEHTVEGNTVSASGASDPNPGDGIVLEQGGNHTIIGNFVASNQHYGIDLRSGTGNLIYNNYLADNGDSNAVDNGSGNTWYISKAAGTNIVGGDYLGGNYWDDYIGVDLNCDGLGDSPYPISVIGDVWDVHPLMTDIICGCPHQSDFDEDGFLTALDLSSVIDILFAGHPDILDDCCPSPRADFDCDGFSTAIDLAKLIDHLFAGGAPPCDPCAP